MSGNLDLVSTLIGASIALFATVVGVVLGHIFASARQKAQWEREQGKNKALRRVDEARERLNAWACTQRRLIEYVPHSPLEAYEAKGAHTKAFVLGILDDLKTAPPSDQLRIQRPAIEVLHWDSDDKAWKQFTAALREGYDEAERDLADAERELEALGA